MVLAGVSHSGTVRMELRPEQYQHHASETKSIRVKINKDCTARDVGGLICEKFGRFVLQVLQIVICETRVSYFLLHQT